MSYTAALADYAASTRFEALPATAVAAAKRVTLDLLGVTLAAARHEPGRVMNAYVRDCGGRPQASVIGTDILTSTPSAALANGTMAADMEQDDVHPEANLHASSVMLPAVLAVAEANDCSGRDFLTALAAAYDVGCRLSIAMGDGRQYARGFHPTAVSGTFGAAAGAARLLGLGSTAVNAAFGLAASQAAGLLTWEMETEHYTKSFQSGVPARNAVVAAELAARGYTGAADTLDGTYNVFDAFAGQRNFARLVAGLGERYEIERTGYKFYSVCRAIHSTLDQLLDLSSEHAFGAPDIDVLDVWLPVTQAPIVDGNILTTHNLQYAVAVALTDRVVGREQTSAQRRSDPALAAVASRVHVHGDDDLDKLYPLHWPSRISLRLTDGRTFRSERHDPRGTIFTPVTDEDVERKFTGMATQAVDKDRAEQLARIVRHLEEMTTVRALTALLSG